MKLRTPAGGSECFPLKTLDTNISLFLIRRILLVSEQRYASVKVFIA